MQFDLKSFATGAQKPYADRVSNRDLLQGDFARTRIK